jgi:LEA14-like dessication related protein
MNKLLTYLSIAAMVVLFASCKNVKDPQFKGLGDFHLKNIGLQQATLGFNVSYFNPNSFGVTVREAEADVYIDSVYMGKFTQDVPVVVTRNADFSIPISGSIALSNLLKFNVQNLPDRTISIRAIGTIKVGKAGLFITKPVEYEGRHSLAELHLSF